MERIERLYKNSHKWLIGSATNITKNRTVAGELVSDLYLYLAERINPKIYYGDTYNLMYCRSFLQTRWINRVKSEKRFVTHTNYYDRIEDVYDADFDKRLEETYNELVGELHRCESTRLWPSSKLSQLYFFDDEATLQQLADDIKLSKSTVFLHIRKMKKHLKNTIPNPFTKDERD